MQGGFIVGFDSDPSTIFQQQIDFIQKSGKGRVHYWRLFFWTLFRRPRLFPLAITLAIYSFHFHQVIALHVG